MPKVDSGRAGEQQIAADQVRKAEVRIRLEQHLGAVEGGIQPVGLDLAENLLQCGFRAGVGNTPVLRCRQGDAAEEGEHERTTAEQAPADLHPSHRPIFSLAICQRWPRRTISRILTVLALKLDER